MGWKGTLRSMQAASRKADRNSQRRQRELQSRQKEYAKMEALEQAAYEVEVYENQIDVLLSVHKECGEEIDWRSFSRGQSRKSLPSRTHRKRMRDLSSKPMHLVFSHDYSSSKPVSVNTWLSPSMQGEYTIPRSMKPPSRNGESSMTLGTRNTPSHKVCCPG